MPFQVTRFAPTPSGFLHLGNLYSILIKKALAEKHGAKILLRIDDLDQERVREVYVQDIFDTLDFMGISYDLGPRNPKELEQEWSQTLRLQSYRDAIENLKSQHLLFACDCSRKKMKAHHPEGYYLGHCLDRKIRLDQSNCALRFNTETSDLIKISEYKKEQKVYSLSESAAFPIIQKKDGMPAYHLASIVDDVNFGVDLVVRGKDLYPSTLTQLAIAQSMENLKPFTQTTFLHHKLIRNQKGVKLSKSLDSSSIQYLRKSGKSKADVFRILTERLGWEVPVDSFQDFQFQLLKKEPLQV